ncbi:MAG: hypothetical protein D6702_08800 [Planctomycetota bacterium]|nr:MAG: hypothetical protein D6702_08800 [Planctomycetota bacterium]
MEFAISMFLITLVWLSALTSMRTGLRSLGGTESSAVAAAAVRELREYTYRMPLDQLDQLDGQTLDPILGDGDPLPGADGFSLTVAVQAVDDEDPLVLVQPGESGSRLITAQCWWQGRMIMEGQWLATEH